MREIEHREVLTVLRRDDAWAVELDGELFGRSTDKEVSKAAANKRARQMQDSGRLCLVRVSGEAGFYSRL